jgi:hypothetical protein
MASVNDKKNGSAVEEVELFDNKLSTIPTAHLRSDSEDDAASEPIDRAPTKMSSTAWIACIALCICYTTAFQQHMCTSSIVKHIDAALGMIFTTHFSFSIWFTDSTLKRSHDLLQLDDHFLHHLYCRLTSYVRRLERYLWKERVLSCRIVHFPRRHRDCISGAKCTHGHCRNDSQRYWRWKSTASVSL